MRQYSNVRFSWYLPLPWLVTSKDWLALDFQPLADYSPQIARSFKAILPNVGVMKFQRRYSYAVLLKDMQHRVLRNFSFPPIFFFSTPQKTLPFNISKQAMNVISDFSKTPIRGIKYSLKVYPAGFAVINIFLDFFGLVGPEKIFHLPTKLLCGKKNDRLVSFVYYLQTKLLKSLFLPTKLSSIRTILQGPKIRLTIIGDSITTNNFRSYAKGILTQNKGSKKISFSTNRRTGDHFAFYKTGVVSFSLASLSEEKRKYLRSNLDLIMDLVFGSELLLPLFPEVITKFDLEQEDCLLERAFYDCFYTLNPEVLAANTEVNALLPTAGLRYWYSHLFSTTPLKQVVPSIFSDLLVRLNEIRLDKWFQVISTLLRVNIPGVSLKLIGLLQKEDSKIRTLLLRQPKLDKQNTAILTCLLSKLKSDLTKRYVDQVMAIDEETIGFMTLHQIEKALEIKGREHSDFKQRINLLESVGLIETQPYRGPGSKTGSKLYRASPKHFYIKSQLKNTITEILMQKIR